MHDARATSANTNDLRGKLLRITPSRTDAAGYTVPAGNLFGEAEDTQDKTRPEIYAMGFRNPFRFSVDPKTGWIGLADYAPDSGTERPDHARPGRHRRVEPDQVAGQLRLAAVHRANNEPFRDVDVHDATRCTRRRLLHLRHARQRLRPQHRPDQPAAGPRAGDVVRLHEVLESRP